MSVLLLVLTDGRDHLLAHTIASAEERLQGPITRKVIHTDAGEWHAEGLRGMYPGWEVIGGKRAGFGGAIDRAWKHIADADERFVFHLEDDFEMRRAIDLEAMAAVLDHHPHIVQMALRRQPWNEQERVAGGIVECWPDQYRDCEWRGHQWLEHRLFFTTNPSLYRTSLCAKGWPTGLRSERAFSNIVFSDLDAVSAFWGARDSGKAVHHVGDQRVGVGY